MDAPVTPVTSGKPRSRIRVQNFVAVEGLIPCALNRNRRLQCGKRVHVSSKTDCNTAQYVEFKTKDKENSP